MLVYKLNLSILYIVLKINFITKCSLLVGQTKRSQNSSLFGLKEIPRAKLLKYWVVSAEMLLLEKHIDLIYLVKSSQKNLQAQSKRANLRFLITR